MSHETSHGFTRPAGLRPVPALFHLSSFAPSPARPSSHPDVGTTRAVIYLVRTVIERYFPAFLTHATPMSTTSECHSRSQDCRTHTVRFSDDGTSYNETSCSLWSPYVIGQTIIFLPCDFYLLSILFLFPRLISAVGDWMSTVLPHMVWP